MKLVRFGPVIAIVALVVPARADTNADVAERVMRVFEQAATIVEANKSDCNAMGDKLGRLADDNAALLRDAKSRDKKMTDAERKALEARLAPRAQAAMVRMMPGLRMCLSNAKVQDAIAKVR